MKMIMMKRIFAYSAAIAMMLSVFALVAIVAPPAYAASGSISLDPTIYSTGTTVTVLVNGGSFSSAALVTFYISTSSNLASPTSIGTYQLSSGASTLSNAAVRFTIPSYSSLGTYYIAASDNGGSTFTSAVSVILTSLKPSISLSSSSAPSGGMDTVTGSGFDPGSTVTVYLDYASGTLLVSNFAATTGSFESTFQVPQSVPYTSQLYIVAQESSSSSANYGITADTTFTLTAAIVVSPEDISPAALSTVTINGYGFYASSTISANSISLTPSSGSITGESNAGVTVSSTGSFSVSVSFDSATASGPITSISITTSPSSSPTSFSDAMYVSNTNPSNLGLNFAITATVGTSSTYNPGDSVTAAVYNFPASQSVDVLLAGISLGTVSTDSNGFGQLASVVPAMPSGSYYPTAHSQSTGLYARATQVSISSYIELTDTSGTLMTTTLGEYTPSDASLTLAAYGLTPQTSYNPTDSLAATGGIYSSSNPAKSLVTSVIVGTEVSGGMEPAMNGTLILKYSPLYGSSTSTSSSATVSISGVSGYGGSNYGYKAIGSATVSSPSSFAVVTPNAAETLSVSYLIPYGATVYPGVTYYYNAYFGSNELQLTYSGLSTDLLYASGGSFSGSFTVPSLSGAYNITVTSNGESTTNAVGYRYVVDSVAGSSYTSGALSVIPQSSSYEVVGYGYYSSPTVYFMEYSGKQTGSIESLTDGGFALSISPGNQPAGTYSVYSEITVSSVNYFVYSSYTVTPALSISAPTKTVSGLYEGQVQTTFTATATGLNPYTYYNIYFGPTLIKTLEADSTGTISSSSLTFKVPALPTGNYSVKLVETGESQSAVSASFKLISNSNITLSTGSQYAFPGQLVQFSVNHMGTTATFTASSFTAEGRPSYAVEVLLNNTYFENVSVTFSSSYLGGTFNGTFIMPNNATGSYYNLSFKATETAVGTYTVSTTTYSGTDIGMFSGVQSEYLGLVTGNGALMTGITQSGIAQIEASVNATLSVPVSELEASVSTINGDLANINTAFGTMNTTLSAIDAKVVSIDNGIATITTELGNTQTTLSSINATLVSFNGSLVTVATTAGRLTTSLNAINATLVSITGNTATISTDLGIVSGKVTSISNGIATIQTSLGTIQTNTNQILPPGGTSFLLEIVILVLIVIAVVFSALFLAKVKRD